MTLRLTPELRATMARLHDADAATARARRNADRTDRAFLVAMLAVVAVGCCLTVGGWPLAIGTVCVAAGVA